MELGKLSRNGDEGNNSVSQTPMASAGSKGKLDFTANQSKSNSVSYLGKKINFGSGQTDSKARNSVNFEAADLSSSKQMNNNNHKRPYGSKPQFVEDHSRVDLSDENNSFEDPKIYELIPELVKILKRPEVKSLIVNPITLKFLSGNVDSPEIMRLGMATPSKFKPTLEVQHDESNTKLRGPQTDELIPHQNPQRDGFKRRDKSREGSRVGTIVLPSGNIGPEIMTEDELHDHINRYLPIAVYQAEKLGFFDEQAALMKVMKKNIPVLKEVNPSDILRNKDYLLRMFGAILKNEEAKIFEELLKDLECLNFVIHKEILLLFAHYNRYDYLFDYFNLYLEHIQARGKCKHESHHRLVKIQTNNEEEDDGALRHAPVGLEVLTETKIISMISHYLSCSENDNLLLLIIYGLGIDKKTLVELFLESGEEDRFVWICTNDDELVRLVDPKELVKRQLMKLLIIFDRASLINIFNMPIDDTEEEVTVYDVLCNRIQEKRDVEAYCNVVIHVHNTFWDMSKLPKFYTALSKVLSGDSGLNEEEGAKAEPLAISTVQDRNDSHDWLVHVQNPLLFCIKLVHFFQKMKAQLDFKDKQISKLSQALLAFCMSYCKNAGEDLMIINLFDQDTRGRDFLEYAFMVGDMNILTIDFIEGQIRKMWDLGRHTMQTVTQFMRLNFMKDEIHKFNMNVFTRKFYMPIEKGDNFQMTFCFTSNSVFLRVVSDILWSIMLIIVEFVFSVRMIEMYKNSEFGAHWMSEYYQQNPIFSVVHLYLRGNYIVSNLLKGLVLKMSKRQGFLHPYFYNILSVLYIIQMIAYPIFFWYEFWYLINLQMLIVLTMLGYVFYNSLSVDDVGVVLRIFARMVYVVIIFGVVSCFVMVLIAYPIHAVYIDFSQVVSGQLFPEQNMFRSLYNGVLTLFEFVFGAVIFVRPYLEQNLYTYTMTFIMVIFSFFGNIMLANMLVAFLSKQFEQIKSNAKYYTLKMQFNLVKIFNMNGLDTIFTMPYPFTALALPFFALMIKKGSTRKKVNIFLRKLIHILNIFVPGFICMNIFLLILIPIRYFEILLFVLIRAPVQPMHILYTFAWILGGPFLLLKLYFQDIGTMCVIMLDFSEDGEELSDYSLSEEAKKSAVDVTKKIAAKGINYLSVHQGVGQQLITIGKFTEYMGYHNLFKSTLKKTAPVIGEIVMKGGLENNTNNEEEDEDDENRFKSKLNTTYEQKEEILLPLILRKFAIQLSRSDAVEDLKIDINFMINKLRNNLNSENVYKIIGFDKTTLDRAAKFINDNSKETDVKGELQKIKDRISGMDKQIENVMKDVDAMRTILEKKLSHLPSMNSSVFQPTKSNL
jgi:hypothetical protein